MMFHSQQLGKHVATTIQWTATSFTTTTLGCNTSGIKSYRSAPPLGQQNYLELHY